ncbi:DNA alkylation repair protein [uncultured Pseudoflavonifractor sp.]|uniref:DNA alkylation repair protein n=1 Tax=uncultured Pseudoflavonifractor sp. TaxID=1221379 RepID=UPI0025E63764|nr:DNA alkylation repair protein [uncultured Pseudoflavonifractor sp.]
MDMENIQDRLFALQDLDYRQFHAKLIPTVDPERIIGVRTPALRRLAKELKGTAEAEAFLHALPHHYYEENNLHGLLLCARSGYEETVAGLEIFLPHVDNWATCDLLSPKAFRTHPPQLPGQIRRWLDSDDTYTIRFGLGMLMSFYLDEYFRPEYLDWAAEVKSQEYYVRMMAAWYFATALAKQYDAALPYLTSRRLEQWTHNKTIQKALESYRITPEQKQVLRALRWKNS